MTHGLFEVLANADDPNGPRAVIAAQTRAKSVFGRYIAQGDAPARLAFIADDLKKMAAEVAEEYGYDDPERLYLASTIALGGGHASDCSCGFCENKGKLPGSKDEKDSDSDSGDDKDKDDKDDSSESDDNEDDSDKHESKTASISPRVIPEFDWTKVAAGPETGDTYQSETLELGANDTGLQDVGSPKIDKANSGDETGWNLEPIDVGSKKHQLEHQDPTDRAKYNDKDFDPSNSVRERIDADTALQPEHTFADNTETWSDKSTQADPVTSKWKLLA